MSLVTMDAMTSSVLREANKSLMAGHTMSSAKPEENHFHEHNRSQNSRHLNNHIEDQDVNPSDQLTSYEETFSADHYSIYEEVNNKRDVLDFSSATIKANLLTGQHVQRPHSSPPEKIVDVSCQSFIPYTASDSHACNSMESFPSLYTNVTNLILTEPPCISPSNHEVQMDTSLTMAMHNLSRSNTPSSHPSAIDIRASLSGGLSESRNFDGHESIFEQQFKPDRFLGRPPNFEMFDTHGYLGQEDHRPNLLPDSDQREEDTYLHSSSDHQRNGIIRSVTNPSLRRDLNMHDIHSVSNSPDSFDILIANSSKYDDSDYSNTSSEHYAGRYSSATPHQPQHLHNNNLDSNKYNFRQSTSTPASTSASIPSPSSSSQAGGDSTRMSLTDTKYDHDYRPPGSHSRLESPSEVNAEKVKGKGDTKIRGAQNLPPCRVCGNMASGLHFGVNTCEACNEFFRRSLKRGATYYCSKNRECQVYGKKRNACSFCRYQRCVEMGMSRDAIKTGRYSHRTRTEYAMEVEKCKLTEVNRAEKEKYEVLLSDLVKYHDKYVKVTTRVPEEELLNNQKRYLELFHTQREHEMRHPPLKAAPQNKRLLDDWLMAQEDLSLTMHDAEMTEQWLRNYINYAKNVPGFKELALSDQASLVRGSWFEFWFLGAFKGYNSSLQVVSYPNGRCFHKEEIKKVFGQEYTDFSFYLANRMRTLDVTPEVMVLIKTVCLTFPDRTSLDNKEAVDKMHWLMVSCLMHTLEKIKPGGTAIFPLVVSKLVELRTLTDIAMRAHKSALFQDVLKDSPLLCEMVDTKTRYVQCAHKNAVSVTGDT